MSGVLGTWYLAESLGLTAPSQGPCAQSSNSTATAASICRDVIVLVLQTRTRGRGRLGDLPKGTQLLRERLGPGLAAELHALTYC